MQKQTTQGQILPDYQHPEGDYRHTFSYHPMNVKIARAEGVYIYDEEGNRYFDVSGGPFSVNLRIGIITGLFDRKFEYRIRSVACLFDESV